ncbi:MAG: hypothetical protein ACLGSA_07335 [Acidobacteriota bacterium]
MAAAALFPLLLALLLAPSGARAAVERALVLPLQPAPGMAYDGTGPALQNVIENMLALNPGLEETYLLRHMREPFATAADLQDYIRGLRPAKAPLAGAAREGARYVLGGRVISDARADIWIMDLMTGRTASVLLPVDAQDGLVAFRRQLMEFLAEQQAQAGMDALAFPPQQAAKALAPEFASLAALRLYGRSYGSYLVFSHLGNRAYLDIDLSSQAVQAAPQAAFAANMHGWLLHAKRQSPGDEEYFRKALKLDPNNVDALDGMMQIALARGGIDAATPWALRKASTRGTDVGPPLAEMHMVLGNKAANEKRLPVAVAHFRKAVALSPDSERAPLLLARILDAMDMNKEAHEAINARLKRPANPAVTSMLLNAKARLYRWNAAAYRKQGKTDLERTELENVLDVLKTSPIPDMFEYSLALQRLAIIAFESGDHVLSTRFLETIPLAKHHDPLFVEALMAHALAGAGDRVSARDQAKVLAVRLAERERVKTPVSERAYGALEQTFRALEDSTMADSIKRQREAAFPPRQ